MTCKFKVGDLVKYAVYRRGEVVDERIFRVKRVERWGGDRYLLYDDEMFQFFDDELELAEREKREPKGYAKFARANFGDLSVAKREVLAESHR